MKIAIPTANGLLCPHFGHCDEFTFVNTNSDTKEITGIQVIPSPEHEPGLLPRWVHENGADIVIAGGMGVRARDIFAENGVQVVVGAPVASPEEVVKAYLDGSLQTGSNLCDH
jgi:predicted Fe-Mo cluster-binding NifX family protein